MGVYENLLPGKENALTPEYLTVKCHFFFQCSDASKNRSKQNAKAAKSYYQTQLRLEDIIFCSRKHDGNPKVYSYFRE